MPWLDAGLAGRAPRSRVLGPLDGLSFSSSGVPTRSSPFWVVPEPSSSNGLTGPFSLEEKSKAPMIGAGSVGPSLWGQDGLSSSEGAIGVGSVVSSPLGDSDGLSSSEGAIGESTGTSSFRGSIDLSPSDPVAPDAVSSVGEGNQ